MNPEAISPNPSKHPLSEITFISLSKIELDRVMVNTLNKYGISTDTGFQVKTRNKIIGKYLERMPSMLRLYDSGQYIKPIILVKHKKYVPPHLRSHDDGITYSIIQGRHRVVASIINGHTHIAASLKV